MSSALATEILSFENFGALEHHLRTLKNKYTDNIKKYEETLGFLLRDTKATSVKTQKVQEKWALDMQRALTTTAAAAKSKQIVKKEESKPNLFASLKGKDNDKDKPLDGSGEWVPLDPMSLFIGKKSRGLAEIYFDSINMMKENVDKINTAISVCSALRAKAATSGSTSLVVSFVNGIPTKVVLKPLRDENTKRYALAFSFAVPSLPAVARTLVVK